MLVNDMNVSYEWYIRKEIMINILVRIDTHVQRVIYKMKTSYVSKKVFQSRDYINIKKKAYTYYSVYIICMH